MKTDTISDFRRDLYDILRNKRKTTMTPIAPFIAEPHEPNRIRISHPNGEFNLMVVPEDRDHIIDILNRLIFSHFNSKPQFAERKTTMTPIAIFSAEPHVCNRIRVSHPHGVFYLTTGSAELRGERIDILNSLVSPELRGKPQFAELKTADSMPSDEKIWLDEATHAFRQMMRQSVEGQISINDADLSEETVEEVIARIACNRSNAFMAELCRSRAQRADPDDHTTAEKPPS